VGPTASSPLASSVKRHALVFEDAIDGHIYDCTVAIRLQARSLRTVWVPFDIPSSDNAQGLDVTRIRVHLEYSTTTVSSVTAIGPKAVVADCWVQIGFRLPRWRDDARESSPFRSFLARSGSCAGEGPSRFHVTLVPVVTFAIQLSPGEEGARQSRDLHARIFALGELIIMNFTNLSRPRRSRRTDRRSLQHPRVCPQRARWLSHYGRSNVRKGPAL
jgi:hypothetical protein